MWFYGIVSFLMQLVSLVVLVVIVRGFFGSKATHPKLNREWYMQMSFCREDIVSQVYFLLSVVFLGFFMASVNQLLGSPIRGVTILFVVSLITLFVAYYQKVHLLLFFGLINLLAWLGQQFSMWNAGLTIKPSAIFGIYFLIFLVFYNIGRIHEKDTRWMRFAFIYTLFGIISVTLSLFVLSTKSGLSMLENITIGTALFASWQITILLVVVLALLLVSLFFGVYSKTISISELIAVLGVSFIYFFIILLPKVALHFNGNALLSDNYNYSSKLNFLGVLTALFFNILVFLELLGLILLGYFRKESWLINLGAIFLFFLIIVKYFDWFFTFLDKSIFFVGAGVLMFGVGWLMEKSRRYIISTIKGDKNE